ncbi:response regulator [bacterium]|nr:response regulator [bacterium]
MKVLIVEDDFCNRRLLHNILSTYACIDHASDGQDAMTALQLSISENDPYDLVMLDIYMPGMDGLETLHTIRKFEVKSQIPFGQGCKVIMVSASEQADDIIGAFRNGCESYLTKPITKKQLIVELQKLKLL